MFTRILIDIGTGLPVHDAGLVSPLANRLFAPFLDFPNYLLTLSRPEVQLLSWLAWLCAIWVIFALTRNKGPVKNRILPMIRGLIVTAVSFILFIVYCIICPLPQYRMTSGNPDEVFLDLHSHTIYSHDGLVTPERNLRWHLNSGFSGWAITEHDRIGKAPLIQREMIRKDSIAAVAIAGQEVNFRKVHLNLLGLKDSFDAGGYEKPAGLIKEVHRQGGAVIVPHYWAETRSPFSMKDLAEAGVDGFEIAGDSSVPLTPEAQREIISVCRGKKLVMLSGTNWHGWRNDCTMWTGFNISNWKQMDIESREKAVIDALRNRETGRFRVLGYRQRFPASTGYVFEPFTGFASYYMSMDMWQQVSWLFWIAIICFLLPRIRHRRIVAIALWEAITIVLVMETILVFNAWRTVADVNKILPEEGEVLIALAVVTSLLSATNLLKKK